MDIVMNLMMMAIVSGGLLIGVPLARMFAEMGSDGLNPILDCILDVIFYACAFITPVTAIVGMSYWRIHVYGG